MRLIVGIPAFNESPTIGSVADRVPRQFTGVDTIEILVVDDGSTDETAARARWAGATVVRHCRNYGLGAAFRTLVRQAIKRGADILVTIDGDGQFDPADIPKLIGPIVAGEVEVCTASRFADPAMLPEMPWVKRWGNRRVAELISSLAGVRLHDASCGFRAYSREALLNLTIHQNFTYTHESLLDMAAKQIPILEVPLIVRGVREYGDSKLADNVFRYGLRSGLIIIRFYRDHCPLTLCIYLALPLSIAGAGFLVCSFAHWLSTGSWLKAVALAGGAMLMVALSGVFFGFMADIASRLRMNQEEILYWLRRTAIYNAPAQRSANPHAEDSSWHSDVLQVRGDADEQSA